MKLVEDWRDAWRWISVNCMLITAAIAGTWLSIPDDLRAYAPPQVTYIMIIALMVCGVAGRLTKQKPKKKKTDGEKMDGE